MDISEMQKRLRSIKVWELMKPILEESSEMILAENKKQLNEGKKSDGSNTKQYKSPIYLKYKESLPTYKASPYADLYKTGSFYDDFYTKVTNNGVKVGSNDDKEKILESRDGKNIFGLTEESLKTLKPIWANKLVESIKAKI